MAQNVANAQAGGYNVARNPTPGTAIAFAVSAAPSETAGYFLIVKNNDAPGAAAKRMILDYIKLLCGVAPASGSAAYFFVKLDNNAKYTSGGSALTPLNVNMDKGNASIAQVFAGALTTIAASVAARCIAGGILRSVIPVVGDEFIFKFGGEEAVGAVSDIAGTTCKRLVVPCPPCIIAPQQVAGLQLWFPSNASTAATFEVEVGWSEYGP